MEFPPLEKMHKSARVFTKWEADRPGFLENVFSVIAFYRLFFAQYI